MHSHVHDIQCGIFSSLFVTSFPALSTVAAVATCMCVVVKAGVLGLLLQGERMNLWFAKIMMNAEISLLSTGHQVMPTTKKTPDTLKHRDFTPVVIYLVSYPSFQHGSLLLHLRFFFLGGA